jgi:hypothetical protein
MALEIFRYQARENVLYAQYLKLLGVDFQLVNKVDKIPFLPISFFKTHEVKTGNWTSATVFSSSGTTGQQSSQHAVKALDFYLENTKQGFEFFYGPISDYCILALLPAYLERKGSSLVAMADYFIRLSKYDQSGFFLNNLDAVAQKLSQCQKQNIPTLLLGVSFALWDLAEQYPMDLSNVIIMETGGMKGRRRELTREELHGILNKAFQTQHIHSEYGMTELLSQAYSKGNGLFYPCPTMKVLTREITDPFAIQQVGKTGVINIIDLANIDSVAFIATDDLGKVYQDGSFEILGRLDASDVRGCNLLVLE